MNVGGMVDTDWFAENEKSCQKPGQARCSEGNCAAGAAACKKLSREDFKCFREYTIFILLVLAAPE